MPKSVDQIRRQLSDNQKLIHEHELQLGGYEGRRCANPRKTNEAIVRLKNANKDLRREMEDAREREREFMKKR